ncbi:MAG: hypothetical protein HYZ27_10085, partial [Deltaproteobacteria bacterium]|nr:hypothetical protein [Deltaproteobacteria bacterium]
MVVPILRSACLLLASAMALACSSHDAASSADTHNDDASIDAIGDAEDDSAPEAESTATVGPETEETVAPETTETGDDVATHTPDTPDDEIPPCQAECATGETICTPDGLAACGQHDADDCLEWGPPMACTNRMVCSEGACACAVGAHLRDGQCVPDAHCAPASCSQHGLCGDAGGDLHCQCDPGYAGPECAECANEFHADGRGGCTTDPCLPNPCHDADRTVCATLGGGGNTCSCVPGFHLALETCVPDATCLPTSCNARGSCAEAGGVVACTCDSGYAGSHCDTCADGFHADGTGACTSDPCLPNPCASNELCSSLSGSASCTACPEDPEPCTRAVA